MLKLIALAVLALPLLAQITVIQGTDPISTSRITLNNNFSYLDTFKVPNTRLISAGTGLTGGGSLAADRTISLAFPTTSSVGGVLSLLCTGDDKLSGITTAGLPVCTPDQTGTPGTGITTINGLTGTVQSFVIGSTGTDFTISSTGTTHTFAIPSASAGNRGLLSSASFTLFTGKEDVLTFAAPFVRSTNAVSMPVATSTVNGYLSSVDRALFFGKYGSGSAGVFSALTLTGAATGCATFTSGVLSSTGVACGSGGGGAFDTNTAVSVTDEMMLFTGTTGKLGKRATITGIPRLIAGVVSAVTGAGTNFVRVDGTSAAGTGGGATTASELQDCVLTRTSATVLTGSPCSWRYPGQTKFSVGSYTITQSAGTGGVNIYGDVDGTIKVDKIATQDITCVGCTEGTTVTAWPINVARIAHWPSSVALTWATTGNIDERVLVHGSTQIEAGPGLIKTVNANGIETFSTTGSGGGVGDLTIAAAQANQHLHCVGSASATAPTCALTPTLTAYSSRMLIIFTPATTNTGALTLNIDGLGARQVFRPDGTALVAADLAFGTGRSYLLYYVTSDTTFRMVAWPASGGAGGDLTTAAAQAAQHLVCNASGNATVQSCNMTPGLTAYSNRQTILLNPATTNTGALTLNIDGLGARQVLRPDGSALVPGDIINADGRTYPIIYALIDTTFRLAYWPPSTGGAALWGANVTTQSAVSVGNGTYTDIYATTIPPLAASKCIEIKLMFQKVTVAAIGTSVRIMLGTTSYTLISSSTAQTLRSFDFSFCNLTGSQAAQQLTTHFFANGTTAGDITSIGGGSNNNPIAFSINTAATFDFRLQGQASDGAQTVALKSLVMRELP